MQIDLRSDTVTKPSSEMLQAMFNAKVGDDVFGEDPTVKALEEKCAAIFGMDNGLFCPSGTMTNQIGINILTNPYEEVICYEGSHIYRYEGGGGAGNSGLSFKLLPGSQGKITVSDIRDNVNDDDIHFPKSSLVALENTVNKAGGSFYKLEEIAEISGFCRENGINIHLDGARLFNAIVATGDDPAQYGKYFDTISICLSKGLGAPVGSVLLCNSDLVQKARRMRKVFGGAMRQAGYMAAAGIYALENNITRLGEDHRRAKVLGEALQSLPFVQLVKPVKTNIVIFTLKPKVAPVTFLERLRAKNIIAGPFGKQDIRMVTHLDFDDEMLSTTIGVLEQVALEKVN